MRWVRFAWVLRKTWVWAAEGAVGRNRRDGNARVESVYDTPVSRPRDMVPTNLHPLMSGDLIVDSLWAFLRLFLRLEYVEGNS